MRNVLLGAFLTIAGVVFAKDGTELLQGVVTQVRDRAITVRTAENQTRTIVLDSQSMIMRGAVHVTPKEVKVGDRVVVDIDSNSVALGLQVVTSVPTTLPTTPQAQPTGESEREVQRHGAEHGWEFIRDGVLFGTFNRQGSPRGDTEFIAQNWLMTSLMRSVGNGTFALNGMFSLDAATIGKSGYSELFQVGEAIDGRPVIDRQHPHDLFMQLAGVWRIPLSDKTGFTIAGGPAGEPALGPVAFMHRASAAENPTAPLGHHTFDSTHIVYGVVTAAVDRGPWIVEGSLFNAREPGENRWNFDFGPLDSVSGRVWFRPNDRWEFQTSTGFLREPEALEPGNAVRSTFSGSWFKRHNADFTAVSAGYGWNHKDHRNRGSVFTEATWHEGMNSIYGRFETQQPEIPLLLADEIIETPESRALHGTVVALTVGGVRDFMQKAGFELGLGADVTMYRVPDVLQTGRPFCDTASCKAAAYGSNPVSFHLFFRVRPPAPSGRMWNMRMSQPMPGHQMTAIEH